MSTVEREQIIIEVLKNHPSIRVSSLSSELGVSEATIRRDLDKLEKSGQIKRFHGGAILNDKPFSEPSVIQRTTKLSNIKQRIGKKAASLIQDGDSIFIGSGTTALALAENLTDKKELTIVTNALTVINALSQAENISIIATGGFLRASELSFIGHITELALQEVRFDKVFIGIPAIDIKAGLTNSYIPEVMTDRTIINMAPEVILLADHSKFNKVASAFLAPIERITTLITDIETEQTILYKLEQLGIKIITA